MKDTIESSDYAKELVSLFDKIGVTKNASNDFVKTLAEQEFAIRAS